MHLLGWITINYNYILNCVSYKLITSMPYKLWIKYELDLCILWYYFQLGMQSNQQGAKGW